MKYSKRNENYFSTLSKWIGNFGVVPLLLFLAFLLWPDLTFFAFLLFLVTRVLETIFQLLLNLILRGHLRAASHFSKLHSFLRLHVLPRAKSHVKVFIFAWLTSLYCHGATIMTSTNKQVLREYNLSLAKGEILAIPLGKSTRFTVANREVITAKHSPAQKRILIKAKSVGISDLMLWTGHARGKVAHYHITVLSKKEYQKLAFHKRKLNSLKLKTDIVGNNLSVLGQVSSLEQYEAIIGAKRYLKESLKNTGVQLEPKLRSEIYSRFIKEVTKRKVFSLDCEIKKLLIHCFQTKETQELFDDLEKEFLIKRHSAKVINKSRQFNISLTLQQFESANGEVFSLGLDKLESSWQQVLDTNPLALVKSNTIQLSQTNYKSKTIARPQIVGRLRSPVSIRIGQEISFFQSLQGNAGQEFRTRQWKFAGLSIDINIKPFGDDLQVEYTSSLSKPEQDIISTNSQKSSIFLSSGQPQVLFNIGFQTSKKDLSKFPLLSTLPLFGNLFRSNSSAKTYKKILCLINIEEI